MAGNRGKPTGQHRRFALHPGGWAIPPKGVVVVQRLMADQDRPLRRIMAAEQGGPGPRPIAGVALAECPPELHRQGAILVPVDGARQGQDLAAQDGLLDETACRLGQPEMKDQISARRRR
jgi:hypothetical protein